MFDTFDQLPLTLTFAQTDPGGNDAVAPPAPPAAPAGEPGPSGEPVTVENGAPGSSDAPGPGPDRQAPPSLLDSMGLPLMIILLLVFMFGMNMLTQRKEKKKRQALLDSLKKNDRVVTVGGIIGIVVEVKPNEVTLKVDESSNTRMKFSRSAIQAVVEDAEPE